MSSKVLERLIFVFSVYEALHCLISGVFPSKRSYKVLYLIEKKVLEREMWFPIF